MFPGYYEYVNRQYAEALPLLQPIAARGNTEAQVMLGSLYQLGLGTEVDEDTSMHWYQSASVQGYGLASSNLAGMFVTQGRVQVARRLYQLAREQGFEHTPAMQ